LVDKLKVGLVAYLDWPLGKGMQAQLLRRAEINNKLGGLDIGGKFYDIEIIIYDSKRDKTGEIEAIKKLVFEDKVTYIIAAEQFFGKDWLDITDANRVIVNGGGPSPISLNPGFHYSFNSSASDTSHCAIIGWYAKNNPEKVKSMVGAYANDNVGHLTAEIQGMIWESFEVKPINIFYPAGQRDFSDLGRRVASINPGTFTAAGGGIDGDVLVFDAVWRAGYRGQFFAGGGLAEKTLSEVMPPEGLEGFISGGLPPDITPPLTRYAQNIQTAWDKKFGKGENLWQWQSPWASDSALYDCLIAGLQQARTTDTYKVAEVIGSGLKYESIFHSYEMIDRPDLGNYRTVSAATTYYLKQIQNGKAKLIATVETDQAVQFARQSYSNKNKNS
jgi:branched-chain amino acid transport system substrate-binding protein